MTQGEVKKTIRKGGIPKWKPLSRLTVMSRLRGGSKPLIDNGDLFGGITIKHDVVKNEGFVGVLRQAKDSSGAPLANIAAIHEFGTGPYVIPVTERMRRFFWFLHFKSGGKIRPLGPNKTVINHPGIPARPFLSTTIRRIRPMIEKELRSTILVNGSPI